MIRRIAKVDANHEAVVKALRGIGATVVSLAAVGRGCPDILVGYHGQNFLFEVKDGSKAKSKRKLTPDEQLFIDAWRGQVAVVESADEAMGRCMCFNK